MMESNNFRWTIGDSAAPRSRCTWTRSEDKLFEDALLAFPDEMVDRWQKIAERLPGKSAMDVFYHYEELVRDVGDIDAGRVEIPSYWDDSFAFEEEPRARASPSQISFSSSAKPKQVKKGGEGERKLSSESPAIHTYKKMGIVEEAHNIRVLGSGDRTIVLAHGFGTDQSVWKHLVPHLVDDHRVILYDNMGAGTTNPDYFDFQRYTTLEGYAYDVIAILEELQVYSCIFVGHSVSAMVGAIASITRPDLFAKILMISASPRYLNDVDYYGGFEQEELDQLFDAMQSNYKAWCSGFAPLAVGGDMDSVAVQEFSRTLFNMRPDIALSVAQSIFQSDLRHLLCHVTVPCHIIQSMKDLAVPVVVSEYLHRNLGGDSIVEVISTDGHLPQLSAPDVVIPVLLRHIRHDITTA